MTKWKPQLNLLKENVIAQKSKSHMKFSLKTLGRFQIKPHGTLNEIY